MTQQRCLQPQGWQWDRNCKGMELNYSEPGRMTGMTVTGVFYCRHPQREVMAATVPISIWCICMSLSACRRMLSLWNNWCFRKLSQACTLTWLIHRHASQKISGCPKSDVLIKTKMAHCLFLIKIIQNLLSCNFRVYHIKAGLSENRLDTKENPNPGWTAAPQQGDVFTAWNG